MNKKIILRIFLIIFFFSLITLVYFNSNEDKDLVEKKKQLELIEKEKVEIIEKNIESSNIIEDVSYSAKDEKGNEYF